jgi:hypothetical protein
LSILARQFLQVIPIGIQHDGLFEVNTATLEGPTNYNGLSSTLQRPTLVLNRNWQPINRWATATEADLPVEVQSLIAYRNAESEEAQALIAGGLDKIRWDLLAYAAKGPKVWATLARKMGPQALRMNLNTLLLHGVFSVEQLSSTDQPTTDQRLGQSFDSVEQLSSIAQPTTDQRLEQSFDSVEQLSSIAQPTTDQRLEQSFDSVEQLSSTAQAASINDWDNRSTLTTLLTGLLTSRRFDDRSSSRTSTFQRT